MSCSLRPLCFLTVVLAVCLVSNQGCATTAGLHELNKLNDLLLSEVMGGRPSRDSIVFLLKQYDLVSMNDSVFRPEHICHLATWRSLAGNSVIANDSVFGLHVLAVESQISMIISHLYIQRRGNVSDENEKLATEAAPIFVPYTNAVFNQPPPCAWCKAFDRLLDGRFGYVVRRLLNDGGVKEWVILIILATLNFLGLGVVILKLMSFIKAVRI